MGCCLGREEEPPQEGRAQEEEAEVDSGLPPYQISPFPPNEGLFRQAFRQIARRNVVQTLICRMHLRRLLEPHFDQLRILGAQFFLRYWLSIR